MHPPYGSNYGTDAVVKFRILQRVRLEYSFVRTKQLPLTGQIILYGVSLLRQFEYTL